MMKYNPTYPFVPVFNTFGYSTVSLRHIATLIHCTESPKVADYWSTVYQLTRPFVFYPLSQVLLQLFVFRVMVKVSHPEPEG